MLAALLTNLALPPVGGTGSGGGWRRHRESKELIDRIVDEVLFKGRPVEEVLQLAEPISGELPRHYSNEDEEVALLMIL